MGEFYRTTYATPYDFKVLDLSTYEGGLEIVKRSGGAQTKLIRFRDSLGREYNLRDMTKNASRLIPPPFDKVEWAEDIVEDSYLANFPFAPFVLPKMADAVKVYHTNPDIFYVPKQPVLGIHNREFGGSVYMLEERPMSAWKDVESFGKPSKIISTYKLISKITKNNTHQVDQPWALRSRLFDILIGDFDRHEDQWRWGLFKEKNGTKTYRPIPRDRDQAFPNYDGVFTAVARNFMPFLRQLQPYETNIDRVKWATYYGRLFDKTFLGEMTWEDWERETKFIQTHLTDEIIDEAFLEMPLKAQELSGNQLKEVLKKRRDNLLDISKRYYKFFSKEIDVVGTDEKELFEIHRLSNGDVDVKVWSVNSSGKKNKMVFHRVFKYGETKKINAYGLNGDDIFIITGEAKKSILVRTIGCLGKDIFKDSSHVKGFSRKTRIYDSKSGNILHVGTEANDRTSKRRDENLYDWEHPHYDYNFLMPLPIIGTNPDDGFFFGAKAKWTKYKFKKHPYAQQHYFEATGAFSKFSLDLIYQGEFIGSVGHFDITIDSRFYGDRFAYNFFGWGNETQNTAKHRPYNRVQNSLFYANPSLRRLLFRGHGEVLLGGTLRRITIEETADRFIKDFGNDAPHFFDAKLQLGANFQFNFSNVDNSVRPLSGLKLKSSFGWENDVWGSNINVGKLQASLSLYYSLDKKQYVTLATRVGTQHSFGRFQFYDAAILGGTVSGRPSTLRGYRAERFYGNTSFFHNSDLRIKIFSTSNRILPFTFGVSGGLDYGRVWLEGEEETSTKWHRGYGGGVWMSPVNALLLRGEYFVSEEDKIFTIGAGFAF